MSTRCSCNAGMNAVFFDLDRIEVLRGPPGTLYGRNATGAVINIITARPTQESGGYASVTGGNYKTLNGEGAVNLPDGRRTGVAGILHNPSA